MEDQVSYRIRSSKRHRKSPSGACRRRLTWRRALDGVSNFESRTRSVEIRCNFPARPLQTTMLEHEKLPSAEGQVTRQSLRLADHQLQTVTSRRTFPDWDSVLSSQLRSCESSQTAHWHMPSATKSVFTILACVIPTGKCQQFSLLLSNFICKYVYVMNVEITSSITMKTHSHMCAVRPPMG